MLTGGLLLVSQAHARPPTRLEYHVEPGVRGCPDAPELRAAVVERVGFEPFDPASDHVVRVTILRSERGLLGRISLHSHDGATTTREFLFGDTECSEIVAAMALALSIALEPEASPSSEVAQTLPSPQEARPERPSDTSSATRNAQPPSDTSRATLSPEPQRDHGTDPRRATQRDFTFHIGAGVHAAAGSAPALAWGGTLSARMRSWNWSLGASVRADAPASSTVDAQPNARVTAFLAAAELEPCWHVDPLRVCAVALLGRMTLSSDGIARPHTSSGTYAAAGGRLGFDVPATAGWVLGPSVQLLHTLRPLQAAIDDRVVWTTPAWSTTTGVTARVALP